MKKILPLFILLCVITAFGCSKTAHNPNSPPPADLEPAIKERVTANNPTSKYVGISTKSRSDGSYLVSVDVERANANTAPAKVTLSYVAKPGIQNGKPYWQITHLTGTEK